MDFADLAALTIHDVKNRLMLAAARAEASGDRDVLRDVLESAVSLSRLLMFYKSEQEVLAVQVDARVPTDLIGELQADIRRQTDLAIDIEISEAPQLAFYDEPLVRLVLLDALYNGLRHARQRLVLGARAEGAGVCFFVRDDGEGFPPAMLANPLPLSPLSREGTGLGLALARRVAAAHRGSHGCGEVRLANQPGGCFSLCLP